MREDDQDVLLSGRVSLKNMVQFQSNKFGFLDFQKCYASADVPQQCVLQKEDYLECLHHTKEVSRALAIKSQYLSSTAAQLELKRKEVVVDVGTGILGLGLIREEGK